MKTPTKAELYAHIDALTRENIRLQEELDKEKQRYWSEHTTDAVEVFYNLVPFDMLHIWHLQLDHIDSTGYWFMFNVTDDRIKQTYCVRHADIKYYFSNKKGTN